LLPLAHPEAERAVHVSRAQGICSTSFTSAVVTVKIWIDCGVGVIIVIIIITTTTITVAVVFIIINLIVIVGVDGTTAIAPVDARTRPVRPPAQ